MYKHESVTIVLPLPPKILSPNVSIATLRGRYAKAAAAKRFRQLAKEAIEAEQLESIPWKHATVSATFYHAVMRRRDQDNAMAALKAAYDGLIDSGLILDDNYETLQRESPVFAFDKFNPRVELTISQLI